MEYENQYKMEIHTEDYRISLEEFSEWLKIHIKERMYFLSEVRKYLKESTDEQLYFIAVDFSIPVVMVKWFIHRFQ